MYIKLLAVFCKDRDSYEKVATYIEEKNLEIIESLIFRQITEFYETDPVAKEVDLEWLEQTFTRKWPRKKDIIIEFIKNISKVSIKNTTKAFLNIRTEDIGFKLAEALHANDASKIDDYLDVYLDIKDVSTLDGVVLNSLESISKAFKKIEKPHFKLRPQSLNTFVGGGIYRGSTVLVYARPNAGKTAFAANNVAGWAHDGLRVLYICNEEPEELIYARIVGRLVGVDSREVPRRWEELIPKASKRGIENVHMMYMNPCTIKAIEQNIKRVKPDVVVIDQLRKVIVRSDDMTTRLEVASEFMRTMGSKYNCAMLELTQASSSVAGKLVLGMEDVADCQTGIQGNLDIMIGVGADDNFLRQGKRMLCVTKNKYLNNEGNFPVKIVEKYSKFVSIK